MAQTIDIFGVAPLRVSGGMQEQVPQSGHFNNHFAILHVTDKDWASLIIAVGDRRELMEPIERIPLLKLAVNVITNQAERTNYMTRYAGELASSFGYTGEHMLQVTLPAEPPETNEDARLRAFRVTGITRIQSLRPTMPQQPTGVKDLHRGVVIVIYKKDPSPRRLIIAFINKQGGLMRRVSRIHENGAEDLKAGNDSTGGLVKYKGIAAPGTSVQRVDVELLPDFNGIPDHSDGDKMEIKRVFRACSRMGYTKGWGWANSDDMKANGGKRQEIASARARLRDGSNYTINTFGQHSCSETQAEHVIAPLVEVVTSTIRDMIATERKYKDTTTPFNERLAYRDRMLGNFRQLRDHLQVKLGDLDDQADIMWPPPPGLQVDSRLSMLAIHDLIPHAYNIPQAPVSPTEEAAVPIEVSLAGLPASGDN